MRVLLDTHAFLWFVLNDPQLSPLALATIEDPANDVLISPASFWEIAIKVSLKKLDLFAPYVDFMKRGSSTTISRSSPSNHVTALALRLCRSTTRIHSTACSWRRPLWKAFES
jgi:PIN domain nuclease of toxin-antitoxin system